MTSETKTQDVAVARAKRRRRKKDPSAPTSSRRRRSDLRRQRRRLGVEWTLRISFAVAVVVGLIAATDLAVPLDPPLASTHADLPQSVQLPKDLPPPQPVTTSPAARSEPESTLDPHADPVGEPIRVVIAAIDVDAVLVPVGLEPDGAMQVPDFGLAGWYTEGPRPGHAGPAAIVAHVDSRAGPDVFYRLRDLLPGDEIHVVYDSGDEVTFVMTSIEQTPKDRLPVESIWPLTNKRLLTLITCGGEFDRSIGHYRDNIVVYASPWAEPGSGFDVTTLADAAPGSR